VVVAAPRPNARVLTFQPPHPVGDPAMSNLWDKTNELASDATRTAGKAAGDAVEKATK